MSSEIANPLFSPMVSKAPPFSISSGLFVGIPTEFMPTLDWNNSPFSDLILTSPAVAKFGVKSIMTGGLVNGIEDNAVRIFA
jgi:hypothetical protein